MTISCSSSRRLLSIVNSHLDQRDGCDHHGNSGGEVEDDDDGWYALLAVLFLLKLTSGPCLC